MNRKKEKSAPALRTFLIIFAPVIIAVVFLLIRFGSRQQISVTRKAVEMGSAVSMTVYAEKGLQSQEKQRDRLSELTSRILTSIGDLDRNIISWRSKDSEVYRFNQLHESGTMHISPELADVIRGSLEIARDSNAAMDITLRPVIDLWGIESYDGKSDYLPPSSTELAEVSASVGYKHLILSEGPSGEDLLEKDIQDLSVDLGAVGKGYALDIAALELSGADISGAVLAIGGSVLAWGTKGEPWQIGIRDPEGTPNDYLGLLSVPGSEDRTVFISTSGGYEKYVEYEGRVFEHIIDGRTFYPAESELYSVTIMTEDSGLASDGLSTACYLLGIEGSKPLLEKYHAEAVFITGDRKIYLTDGLTGQLSLTNSSYTVMEVP